MQHWSNCCAVLLTLGASLLFNGSSFGATIYRLTDLGTLGGDSSYGTAINDNGAATGYSLLSSGETRAFLWTQDNGMQDLGSVGGGDSKGFDINNANHVVGVSGNQAFRWTQDNGMVLIDPVGGAGVARDLNESSTAVGSRGSLDAERTLRWDSSNSISTLFPFSNTGGVAINDQGDIVGTEAGGNGYFSENGAPRLTIPGFIPTDINNNRLITGSIGDIAAILDFDNSMTTLLGKLTASDTYSRALGINEFGTVVGISAGTGAFIWDSSMESLGNLTSMLSSDYAGWTILAAEDINNMGHIIGVGRYNGVDHAVILTPVPEPTSCALAIVAAASMIVFSLQRFRACLKSAVL